VLATYGGRFSPTVPMDEAQIGAGANAA